MSVINMIKRFDIKSIIIVILSVLIIIETFIIGMTISSDKSPKNDMYLHAETIDDINQLRTNGKPLIIMFGADYCPACINYKPYIQKISDLYGEDVIIKIVDTVDYEMIRDDYNIEFIPSTLIFDKNGNPYKPSKDLDVTKSDEDAGEREYVSSEFTIAEDGHLEYNDQFEYGLDKNNNHAYTKFVGLLDMLQLEEIIMELIKN